MTTTQSRTTDGGASVARPLLITLFTETSLHPGTGQGTGIVDLPVQRERHTEFPIIPSTGLKGSLREAAEHTWGRRSPEVTALFGPEPRGGADSADLHAGAVGFADARLLAFPVRSSHEVFLWVICPLVLARLARDLAMIWPGTTLSGVSTPDAETAYPATAGFPDQILLEDLTFAVPHGLDASWSALATILAGLLPGGDAHREYRGKFTKHLTLIPDNDFKDLTLRATQVTARIALNERKTTTGGVGNLWYEETIPADTLLYTVLRPEPPRPPTRDVLDAARVRTKLLEMITNAPYLQLGGNETVGHGWCAVGQVASWPPPAEKKGNNNGQHQE